MSVGRGLMTLKEDGDVPKLHSRCERDGSRGSLSKPIKQERCQSASSVSSSGSSSSSSGGLSAKKRKLERDVRKAQKAERRAQEHLQKFADKFAKRLSKFSKSHKRRPVAAHAFFVFLLEWVNRICADSEDLKLRRLPTDSRSYRYVTNVKNGDRILMRLGCEPGANSWIVKDDKLQLLRLAVDPLEEALKSIGRQVEAWKPEPMGTPKKLLGKGKTLLTPHESRTVGAILAHACGDVLGAPVEGWHPELLQTWFRRLGDFQDLPHNGDAPGGLGVYTADTELMLATCKAIVKRELFDVKTLAEGLAQTYSKGRPRAYPETMSVILPQLAEGLDYRKAGSYLNPEGHIHNEGLTRMLPIALCFRNAPDEVLMDACRGASLFSTVHVTAVSSYFAYAKGVSLMLAAQPEDFDAIQWVESIAKATPCNDVRSRLQLVLREAKPARSAGAYHVPEEVRDHLSDTVQAEAVELLAMTICVVCEFWHSPVEAIIKAVHVGGDTNTLASCVGGLMGALHGHEWLPLSWYKVLENDGEEGRDHIVRTALLLSGFDFFKPGHVKNNAKPIPFKAGLYNYQGMVKVEKKFGAKETIYSYG
eukprot:GGOE01056850.1.p1 GENE.GGOE01056850.1~~GGOE01056850.1.p1  ORF type:complete len:591 (-),score=144.67 GGOE01056850.1:244-2016(-)